MRPQDVSIVAYTVRGIERISLDEVVADVPGVQAGTISPKMVRFAAPWNPSALAGLRTVDDVGVEVVGPTSVVTADELTDIVRVLPLDDLRTLLGSVRTIDETISVTVTARNSPIGNMPAIDALVRKALGAAGTGRVLEKERASIDLRVFADADAVNIGARVFVRPLHHRDYRVKSVTGAIRPTVAAALIRLAGLTGDQRVWDPFCGSGTILCEAALNGFRVEGSDLSSDAVDAARENLRKIDRSLVQAVHAVDALRASVWTQHERDVLITNPPWNHQVKAMRGLVPKIGASVAERARSGVPSFVLITRSDRLHAIVHKTRGPEVHVVSGTVGLLGQTPSISAFMSPQTDAATVERLQGLLTPLEGVEIVPAGPARGGADDA